MWNVDLSLDCMRQLENDIEYMMYQRGVKIKKVVVGVQRCLSDVCRNDFYIQVKSGDLKVSLHMSKNMIVGIGKSGNDLFDNCVKTVISNHPDITITLFEKIRRKE